MLMWKNMKRRGGRSRNRQMDKDGNTNEAADGEEDEQPNPPF